MDIRRNHYLHLQPFSSPSLWYPTELAPTKNSTSPALSRDCFLHFRFVMVIIENHFSVTRAVLSFTGTRKRYIGRPPFCNRASVDTVPSNRRVAGPRQNCPKKPV
ncbi:hypothetical protein J6590_054988 [Homalodisca vitripennis]|nr:hypothetical protein J6590_054988 [Homalodisca vitripennis]